ncbi:MAG: hypothetical protein IBX36_01145 [Dehalococcoidia bacterium]|nr:hypothetical protein [Dehalococcoidia bacterium]
MEIEGIGVVTRLGMRGLKNKGLMEISEDPKSGDFILVISKGIREKWYWKWLRINLPEGMWRVKCKKEEVSEVLNKFLAEKILA